MVCLALTLGGCAGKFEQLAKCSANDSPVPAIGYGPGPQPDPLPSAFDAVRANECGPMRPVKHF